MAKKNRNRQGSLATKIYVAEPGPHLIGLERTVLGALSDSEISMYKKMNPGWIIREAEDQEVAVE